MYDAEYILLQDTTWLRLEILLTSISTKGPRHFVQTTFSLVHPRPGHNGIGSKIPSHEANRLTTRPSAQFSLYILPKACTRVNSTESTTVDAKHPAWP